MWLLAFQFLNKKYSARLQIVLIEYYFLNRSWSVNPQKGAVSKGAGLQEQKLLVHCAGKFAFLFFLKVDILSAMTIYHRIL